MLRTLLKRIYRHRASFGERHVIAIILGSALTAMGLSLAIGLQQSVWFDEAYSIFLAKQSWGQLLYLTSVDTHPPLYYALLKVWGDVFGWSELALRSPSMLALGASVAVGGLLIKRLFGAQVAVVAVMILAISPFLLRYGFEIRMYAIGSLVGIAATYVLVLAEDARTRAVQLRRYALYAVLVALGMYLFYYMAFLWIAHASWLAWMGWRRERSLIRAIWKPWLAAYLGAVILYLPWIPTFLDQLGNGALTSVAQSLTLDNLISIVSFYTVYEPLWRLGPIMSVAVLFALVVIGWLGMRAYRSLEKHQRPYFVLLAMYILVPVLLLTLIGFVRPMYLERYVSHVAIGASLALGVAVAVVWPRIGRVGKWAVGIFVVTLLIGVVQLAMYGNYNFQRTLHPAIKEAARLATPCSDNAKVVAGDPYAAIELLYYVQDCPVYFYEPSFVLTGGYAPLSSSELQLRDPVSQLADTETVYYIYYDQPRSDLSVNRQLVERTTFDSLTIDVLSAAPRD